MSIHATLPSSLIDVIDQPTLPETSDVVVVGERIVVQRRQRGSVAAGHAGRLLLLLALRRRLDGAAGPGLPRLLGPFDGVAALPIGEATARGVSEGVLAHDAHNSYHYADAGRLYELEMLLNAFAIASRRQP